MGDQSRVKITNTIFDKYSFLRSLGDTATFVSFETDLGKIKISLKCVWKEGEDDFLFDGYEVPEDGEDVKVAEPSQGFIAGNQRVHGRFDWKTRNGYLTANFGLVHADPLYP